MEKSKLNLQCVKLNISMMILRETPSRSRLLEARCTFINITSGTYKPSNFHFNLLMEDSSFSESTSFVKKV